MADCNLPVILRMFHDTSETPLQPSYQDESINWILIIKRNEPDASNNLVKLKEHKQNQNQHQLKTNYARQKNKEECCTHVRVHTCKHCWVRECMWARLVQARCIAQRNLSHTIAFMGGK